MFLLDYSVLIDEKERGETQGWRAWVASGCPGSNSSNKLGREKVRLTVRGLN